jgi:hypothetical protein
MASVLHRQSRRLAVVVVVYHVRRSKEAPQVPTVTHLVAAATTAATPYYICAANGPVEMASDSATSAASSSPFCTCAHLVISETLLYTSRAIAGTKLRICVRSVPGDPLI